MLLKDLTTVARKGILRKRYDVGEKKCCRQYLEEVKCERLLLPFYKHLSHSGDMTEGGVSISA